MTITIQPGPCLTKWGPQGQAFYRDELTPDAADSIAEDLRREARAKRRELALEEMRAGEGFVFSSIRNRAPCDLDETH